MRKDTARRNSQKGSAILLSLGILSLVLIVAMSFAFSANTRRSIARSQGEAVKARMIADEAVNVVVSDMQYMFEKTNDSTNQDVSSVYPPETMNRNEVSNWETGAATTLPNTAYNQSLLLFDRYRFNGSGNNPFIQNFAISSDPGRASGTAQPDDVEKHYISMLFGFAKPQWYKDFSELTAAQAAGAAGGALENNDLGNSLNYLPQLRLMVGNLRHHIGFAPPLVMSHTLSDGTNSTTRNQVTGRYAYILLDETNKININSAISLSGAVPMAIDYSTVSGDDHILGGGKYGDRLAPYAEIEILQNTAETFLFNDFVKSNKVAKDSYAENDTIRLGILPEELAVNDRYVDNLLSVGDDVKVPWQSYEHLLSGLDKGETLDTNRLFWKENPTSTADIGDLFTYTFFSMDDIEAYWDPEADSGNGQEMARFDLSGVSWGNNEDKLFTGSGHNAWEYGASATGSKQADWKKLVWRICGLSETDAVDADPQDQLSFWSDRAAGTVNYSAEETTDDITNYKGHLDWLHKMVDNDGHSVGVQVAANIKDFSDSDDIATTDFKLHDETSTGTTTVAAEELVPPQYCGNEKVAYFNEFVVRSGFNRTLDATSYDYSVDLYVGVEMLNIYCIPGKGDCDGTGDCTVPVGDVSVKLYGTLHVVKYEYELDPDNPGEYRRTNVSAENYPLGDQMTGGRRPYLSFRNRQDGWSDWSDTEHIVTTEMTKEHLGYHSFYMKKSCTAAELAQIAEIPDNKITEITTANANTEKYAFLFTVTKMVAYSYEPGKDERTTAPTEMQDALYDVACTPEVSANNSNSNSDVWNDVEDTDTHEDFMNLRDIVCFQVRDSRFNHRSDDAFWVTNGWSGTEGCGDTMDQDNKTTGASPETVLTSNTNWEAAVDMESVNFDKHGENDQHTYSTAFIRNAPMKSLWELGAIHRGYPNQTINLKEYCKAGSSDSVYYSATAAGTDKIGGDAGILDQVKIGPLQFVKGKINANQRNPKVWEKLLHDENFEYSWYDRTVCADMGATTDATKMAVVQTDDVNWKIDASKLNWTQLDEATSYSRAAIANVFTQRLQTQGVTNDRDMESYIGKTAGLLTTRGEAYSLLVVAESLEDITDTLESDVKTVLDSDDAFFEDFRKTQGNLQRVKAKLPGEANYETRYCNVTGRQKVLVQLVRDAWRGDIKIVGKKYIYDE